jgi:hypothetical protein
MRLLELIDSILIAAQGSDDEDLAKQLVCWVQDL